MRLKMKLSGLPELKKKMADIEKKIDAEMSSVIEETANKVMLSAKSHAPYDIGQIEGNIVVDGNGLEYKVIAKAPHSGFAEFGTKSRYNPNIPIEWREKAALVRSGNIKTGDYEEFVQNITEWAMRKGVPSEAIGSVIWSIFKYGRSATPFMRPAAEENMPIYAKEMQDRIQALLNSFNE